MVKNDSWNEVDQLKDTVIYHPQMYKQAEEKKVEFSKKLLLDTIGKENLSKPQVIVESLLKHCEKITKVSRTFIEEHPKTPLPDDSTVYCGKLDHTTCIALKLRKISQK